MDLTKPIAVLGAGSWGTAIAMTLAKQCPHVLLWSHQLQQLQQMAQSGQNQRYLPGIELPAAINFEADLEKICRQCQDIILVVPSHAFRGLLLQLKPFLTPQHRLAWGTKGLDPEGHFLHRVVTDSLSFALPKAILSGPSFAREVALYLPTAVTIASDDETFTADLVTALSHPRFRVYQNNDLIGVQVAGAVKNVLAVASGIGDGLGLGANSRAALITRGLAEMMRLGLHLGGQQQTFMGLAGMGDLILTCTDNQSRNRRFGLAIGQGQSSAEALAAIDQVVEGHQTTQVIYQLAQTHAVDMPITTEVYRVLYEQLSPKAAVQQLFDRPSRME